MAITITPAAADRVNTLKKKRQTPQAILRVGVRGGGCSGLSYYVDLVDTPDAKDKVFTFDEHGVTIAVDRKSYLFINGSELDFEKTMVKTGFVFRNPLSNRSCSCGDSFTL
jgi:iron-sulfur cluster assembly protein